MSNIVLIGMPGCGKSTVGVILAKTLGIGFVDTDLIIQQREKRLLQEIIDNDGIEKFLDCEAEAVKYMNCENSVVATGGRAAQIIPHCNTKMQLDDNLLLDGLIKIYYKNI